MKRNKSLLSLIALFTVMGCGSSTVSDSVQKAEEANPPITEQQKEPLDLTGLWIQEGKSSETRMVAEIKENTIGIFFIMEGDEDPWTYWIGTYEKPTDSSDEYTWTSENTYSGNGLLASNAESKEFSYKGGKLSYSVTILSLLSKESGTLQKSPHLYMNQVKHLKQISSRLKSQNQVGP